MQVIVCTSSCASWKTSYLCCETSDHDYESWTSSVGLCYRTFSSNLGSEIWISPVDPCCSPSFLILSVISSSSFYSYFRAIGMPREKGRAGGRERDWGGARRTRETDREIRRS